jgi:hypothetical protein
MRRSIVGVLPVKLLRCSWTRTVCRTGRAGSMAGLITSMIVVPIMSCAEGDLGGLGELRRVGDHGFERVSSIAL